MLIHFLYREQEFEQFLIACFTQESGWADRVLRGLYALTSRFSAARPHDIDELWASMCANPANVAPVIEFLLAKVDAHAKSDPTSFSRLSFMSILFAVLYFSANSSCYENSIVSTSSQTHKSSECGPRCRVPSR